MKQINPVESFDQLLFTDSYTIKFNELFTLAQDVGLSSWRYSVKKGSLVCYGNFFKGDSSMIIMIIRNGENNILKSTVYNCHINELVHNDSTLFLVSGVPNSLRKYSINEDGNFRFSEQSDFMADGLCHFENGLYSYRTNDLVLTFKNVLTDKVLLMNFDSSVMSVHGNENDGSHVNFCKDDSVFFARNPNYLYDKSTGSMKRLYFYDTTNREFKEADSNFGLCLEYQYISESSYFIELLGDYGNPEIRSWIVEGNNKIPVNFEDGIDRVLFSEDYVAIAFRNEGYIDQLALVSLHDCLSKEDSGIKGYNVSLKRLNLH